MRCSLSPHLYLNRNMDRAYSSSQLALDSAFESFSSEATNTSSLASMTLSSFTGKLARLGILSTLSGARQAAPLQFLSHLGSVAAEAATMTAIGRGGSPWPSSFGQAQGPAPTQEFLKHFVNFGIFRLTGGMGAASGAPTQHLIQSLAMMAGHQAAAFAGLETGAVNGASTKSLAEQFLEANLATLQIAVGGKLAAEITGGRLQRIERNLEQEAHLTSSLSLFPSTSSPLPLSSHILVNATDAPKRNEAADGSDLVTSSTRAKNFNIQEAAFPTLDLTHMSEAEITRRLFARSFHAQLFLMKRLGLRNGEASVLSDFQEMARYQGCSVQDFFTQNGASIYRYFPEAYRTSEVGESPFTLSERVSFPFPHQNPSRLRSDLRFFFDLALHSRVAVAPCLFMAKKLAAQLGMNWREMVEDYQHTRGPYEQHAFEVMNVSDSQLSFDQYFDQMMYGDGQGVYMSPAQTDLIGAHSGLFRTPSEYPPAAAILIRSVYDAWTRQACPQRFEVVEMGAGNGTLARNMLIELDELANKGDESWQRFRAAFYYHIVERSPMLQEHQRESLRAFEDRCRFHLTSAVSDPLPDVEKGVFLSVELLDMFPPTQIVFLEGNYYEVHISSRGGFLQETLQTPRLEVREHLSRHRIPLQEGQRFFIHLDQEKWLQNIRTHLKQGEIISIDYGGKRDQLLNKSPHRKLFRRFGGRNTVYNDRANPYFAYLGQVQMGFYIDPLDSYNSESTGLGYRADMTVDVDFSALAHAAENLEAYEGQGFMNLYDYALSVCTRPGQLAPAWGNWGQSQKLFHGFWTHTVRLGPIP